MCLTTAVGTCDTDRFDILAADIAQSNRNLSNATRQECTDHRTSVAGTAAPCNCTASNGVHFLGTTQNSGGCDCSCQQCDDPGEDTACGSGLCGSDGCCASPCGTTVACEMSADCPGTYCVDGCCSEQCVDVQCGNSNEVCSQEHGDYHWVCNTSSGCCVFDSPGCGAYAACDASYDYGKNQCQGTGYTCDPSTGCCTVACVGLNSLGDCPPGTFVAYLNSAGQACCERTGTSCGFNLFCSSDADCVSMGYPDELCVDGCCGCSPDRRNSCGLCGWGEIQCNGTCSDDGTCNCYVGWACGNCGTLGCDGSCGNDPCPHPPGGDCGGCGTYESDGATCNDPCNGCSPHINEYCGNCGSVQCNGSCNDPCACVSNQGLGCGRVECNGSCGDPCCYAPNAGSSCGGCGTVQCDGTCNDPCCASTAGDGCGNCGTVRAMGLAMILVVDGGGRMWPGLTAGPLTD